MNNNCYALYKGDYLLSIGTLSEIQKETGKSREWLRYMLYPRYTRRLEARASKGRNALRLIHIDSD